MAKEKGFKFFTDAKARKTQKRFAHFLRGYRKRQGLTQKQLAINWAILSFTTES